jgi:hypothetical protein
MCKFLNCILSEMIKNLRVRRNELVNLSQDQQRLRMDMIRESKLREVKK